MADLRDSLPNVACELASYEAVFRGASGSTAAALGLVLADNLPRDTHLTQVYFNVSFYLIFILVS